MSKQDFLAIKKTLRPINATVELPGSKSITNRALLLAALAKGESRLHNFLHCDDTVAFISALEALGIKLKYDQEKKLCIMQGCHGLFPNSKAKVWCQDSGLAVRFLLAACANQQSGVYQFDGSSRLRERPLKDLILALTQQGADIFCENENNLPLKIMGKKLLGGEIFVPGNMSSQFLSALLIIAPYMQSDTIFQSENLISQPYIHLTSQVMKSFGVSVDVESNKLQNRWRVLSGQNYIATDYFIEPDLSAASYFFAAAAVSAGSVTVKNIDRKGCLQGDIKFLEILEKMGCKVFQEHDDIKVQGAEKLKGIAQVDMGDISDTMMTLAAIAPFANSPTLITNIANARVKESDRIYAMEVNLNNLGVRTESGDSWLKIYPGTPKSGVVNCFNDHRIAMSCALVGLKVDGVIINKPECVAKTFPDFFDVFSSVYC